MNIGGLPVWLGYCFLFIGAMGAAMIIAGVCVYINEVIKTLVENYKYRYKYNWNKPTEKCWVSGCHTADWWFCQSAQPRERDPDSQ